MGRIALDPKFKRSKQIIAKVTEREHAKIMKQAVRRGITMSSLLRQKLGFER